LRVAVVRLPHIANFTDFAPLEAEPGVELVYAEEPAALAGAALVVLPGSKDTIADLRALKARGFAAALAEHRARGGLVLGVCGGYQMLGRAVADPHHVESGGEEATLGREKITRRVRARWRPDGPGFEGYEIHVGVTAGDGPARPLLDVEGQPEGCASADRRVWGTHLHGLFESGPARRHVLDWARGAPAVAGAPAPPDHRALREAAYDRLADALADALDGPLLSDLGVS
jgi:adenosylcobyric acid synthase